MISLSCAILRDSINRAEEHRADPGSPERWRGNRKPPPASPSPGRRRGRASRASERSLCGPSSRRLLGELCFGFSRSYPTTKPGDTTYVANGFGKVTVDAGRRGHRSTHTHPIPSILEIPRLATSQCVAQQDIFIPPPCNPLIQTATDERTPHSTPRLTPSHLASPPTSAASSNSSATARTSAPASTPRERYIQLPDGGVEMHSWCALF